MEMPIATDGLTRPIYYFSGLMYVQDFREKEIFYLFQICQVFLLVFVLGMPFETTVSMYV